jgi:hypothetical protein
MFRRCLGLAAPATLALLSLLPACGGAPDAPPSPEPDGRVEGETVTVLAVDPNVAPEVTLESGTLYWIDRGLQVTDSIHAVPASGGDAAELYQASPSTAAIEALAADADNIYFTEVWGQSEIHADVKAVPRAGGEPRVLWSGAGVALGIAVYDGYVYFGASIATDSGVQRVPIAGGAIELVAMSAATPGPSSIAVNASGVYFVDLASGNLMKLGPSKGQPVTVANAEDVETTTTPLALTGGDVFWGSNTGVMGASATGGAVFTVARGAGPASSIISDGSAVYWIDPGAGTGPATLRRVTLSADGAPGASSVIADGLNVTGELVPQGLALDDTFVYWSASGKVSRAKR